MRDWIRAKTIDAIKTIYLIIQHRCCYICLWCSGCIQPCIRAWDHLEILIHISNYLVPFVDIKKAHVPDLMRILYSQYTLDVVFSYSRPGCNVVKRPSTSMLRYKLRRIHSNDVRTSFTGLLLSYVQLAAVRCYYDHWFKLRSYICYYFNPVAPVSHRGVFVFPFYVALLVSRTVQATSSSPNVVYKLAE